MNLCASMPLRFSIRPANPADIAPLSELAARAYARAFAHLLAAGQLKQRPVAYYRERFQAQIDGLWLAESSDAGRATLLGYFLLRGKELEQIFLDPGGTDHGVGRALLQQAERLGATELECFAGNHRARRFYKRAGWQLTEAFEREFEGHRQSFVRYRLPIGPQDAS